MEVNRPKIRFKGFEWPWNKNNASDSGIYSKGRGYSKNGLAEEGTPIILYGRLYTNYQFSINEVDTYAVPKENSVYSFGNEVIIPASGETAEDIARAAAVEQQGVLLGGDLHIIRTYSSLNPAFIALTISTGGNKKELASKAQGKSVVHIHNSDVQELILPIPTLQEQTYITDMFQNLDTLITLTQQKLDQLKTLKKACLEKMFPKEGETVPEIRFKGLEGPWEWKKLGEIADIVGGGTPSTSIPEYWSGNISWYSPAEIGNKVFVSESQRKITKAGYNHCSAAILPPGTVLFTSRAGIGKTAILEKEGCTNQGFQSIIPHKEQLDSYFIYSRTAELKQYGETVGAGSTFVEVSGKQMADMDILIPAILEQRVIGGFFRNLDNLISLIQQKLDQLKNIKKALLEKMFV